MLLLQPTLDDLAKRALKPEATLGASPMGAVVNTEKRSLLGSFESACDRKNFDDAYFVRVEGMNHLYEIDWDKDENKLPIGEKYDVTIPGRGAITDSEKCGSFHGSYLAGDKLRAVLYSCHKPTCPRCFREWAARQGGKSAAFIWGIKRWSGDTIYHSVFSPVEGRYTIDKLVESIKTLMYKFHSGDSGRLGYAYVIHPYRLRCLGGHPSPRERGYGGNKLPAVCPECGMPWEWYYSPHVHVVSNFYVDCTSKVKADAWNQAQANAGIKYANISQDNHYYDLTHQVAFPRPGFIDSVDTLESIVKYELGHSLVKKKARSQAIVYVGSWCRLNYNAEWTPHKEIECDDNDVPFRRVHSVGVVDGSKMKINVHFLSNGLPSWWNDWDDAPVYKYKRVWECKVTPRRKWCDMHKRFERVDPLKRQGLNHPLDNLRLEAYGDVDG